jgi:hypothetical protein
MVRESRCFLESGAQYRVTEFGQGKLHLQLGFELRIDNPPLPLAEPWPVKDKTNARGAAVILRHSFDPGRTEDTVQFKTVRKMKLAMVNMAHAAAGFEGNLAVEGSEGNK